MKRRSLPEVIAFDWDEGNSDKNWTKHRVSQKECTEIFANNPFILEDLAHSQKEDRYYAVGHTNIGRSLIIVYTIRNKRMRVISARPQNKKERQLFKNY